MEDKFLKEIAKSYGNKFFRLADVCSINELSFEINSLDFDNKYKDTEDVRYAETFYDMFSKLAEVDDMPCLYRWEILSSYNTDEIKDAVGKLHLNTPRVLKKTHSDSNTLYVGKVQSHIVGRVIQHMGYHKNRASHGLQLCEWASQMKLIFKLHIVVLSKDVIGVEEIFEKELAYKYKPIIGIH